MASSSDAEDGMPACLPSTLNSRVEPRPSQHLSFKSLIASVAAAFRLLLRVVTRALFSAFVPWRKALSVGGLLVALYACATIPKDRYGVDAVEIIGMEQMDEDALKACLATHPRERFALSSAERKCGVPPFDGSRLNIELWRWPWIDWPLYDQAILERDVQRIERWYRARGFYEAKVENTYLRPQSAQQSDRIRKTQTCDREGDDEGCKLSVFIKVDEGRPVSIDHLAITGIDALPSDVRLDLWDAMTLELNRRFDEFEYDQSKEALVRVLRESSYARAEVEGEVLINPKSRRADVRFHVKPGPSCVLGDVRVVGNEELPVRPILGMSLLRTGDLYRQSDIDDAQRAVYSLGAFSSVTIEPQIEHAAQTKDGNIIDVIIRVAPGRLTRLGVGFGVQSGRFVGFSDGSEIQDVPQWDVHLLGIAEHRNFFGGLRRIRIEERPRLIFNNLFPFPRRNESGEPGCCSHPLDRDQDPVLGNLTLLEFRQPSFIEARTTLVAAARWDLGPDPFFRGDFFRHDLDARIAPERYFFDGKLYVSVGLHGNLLLQVGNQDDVPSNYHLLFLEQILRLDLRDDARQPTRGFYAAVAVHEAGFFIPSSWDYIRVTPEVRAYAPLPWGLVLAGRFAMGAMFIFGADSGLDDISNSDQLGPFRYRLRGGGPSSNRGFLPGRLGDAPNVEGLDGGLRRWEASLELRVRLTQNFGVTLFGDMGDVNQGKVFRFDHLNTALGFGLRYRTPIGPLRFDLGWLIPPWRVVGDNDPPPNFEIDFGLLQFPGAIHITIGEAF